MDERHELFDELDAFNPLWFKVYHTIPEAVADCATQTAYVEDMYIDWKQTPEGVAYIENIGNVFDYQGAIEAEQQAEAESSLPFKLSNIGSTPHAS